MILSALIRPGEDGGWWTEVNRLPGCFASGLSRDELAAALEEAVELYLSAPDQAAQAHLVELDDLDGPAPVARLAVPFEEWDVEVHVRGLTITPGLTEQLYDQLAPHGAIVDPLLGPERMIAGVLASDPERARVLALAALGDALTAVGVRGVVLEAHDFPLEPDDRDWGPPVERPPDDVFVGVRSPGRYELRYDPEGDALEIVPLPRRRPEYTIPLVRGDYRRNVDYDADDRVAGVELLWVREGVELDGLPYRAFIEEALTELARRMSWPAPPFA